MIEPKIPNIFIQNLKTILLSTVISSQVSASQFIKPVEKIYQPCFWINRRNYTIRTPLGQLYPLSVSYSEYSMDMIGCSRMNGDGGEDEILKLMTSSCECS